VTRPPLSSRHADPRSVASRPAIAGWPRAAVRVETVAELVSARTSDRSALRGASSRELLASPSGHVVDFVTRCPGTTKGAIDRPPHTRDHRREEAGDTGVPAHVAVTSRGPSAR
jgi:hypothetical protein